MKQYPPRYGYCATGKQRSTTVFQSSLLNIIISHHHLYTKVVDAANLSLLNLNLFDDMCNSLFGVGIVHVHVLLLCDYSVAMDLVVCIQPYAVMNNVMHMSMHMQLL